MFKILSCRRLLFLLAFFSVYAQGIYAVSTVNLIPDTSNNSSQLVPATESSLDSAGNIPTFNISSTANEESQLNCTDSGSRSASTRPTSADCAQALLKMPLQMQPVTFVRGHDARLPGTLPKKFSAGRCVISFELADGHDSEWYSWVWLRTDALALLTACHEPVGVTGKPFRTGGKLNTGPLRGISVNVEKTVAIQGSTNDQFGATSTNATVAS